MTAGARTVVLHADDLGMCHATVVALERLVRAPVRWSGAVMAPCPWFNAVAALARKHRRVDLGLHLTLTSEWTNYRWGPLSTGRRRQTTDAEGYFPRGFWGQPVRAGTLAAAAEFEAQAAKCEQAGITLSHVDNHMGTAFAPRILPAYIRLALRRRLPLFLPRLTEDQLKKLGARTTVARATRRLLLPWLAGRFPLFDGFSMFPLDGKRRGPEAALRILDALPPGLHYVMCHPTADTPEARAICPDWKSRASDLETLMNPVFARGLKRLGIRTTTCRTLCVAMRQGRSSR